MSIFTSPYNRKKLSLTKIIGVPKLNIIKKMVSGSNPLNVL